MGKRLTDTGKWDKIWFRKLSPTHKAFWVYICDRCDHAGIWEVDFETAEHYIGAELQQNETLEVFSKQFKVINGGSRWLIKDFIPFQYGKFNEDNKMFKPVKTSLERHGASMEDIWGIDPLKVMVKVKVKRKVILEGGVGETYVKRWNEKMPWKILSLNSIRQKNLGDRIQEPVFVEGYDTVMEKVLASDFLMGKRSSVTNPHFRADFDWVIANDLNYNKILEGKYDDREDPDEVRKLFGLKPER